MNELLALLRIVPRCFLNFVLPGVLHGDEQLGKIPRNASSNLILSTKCPWLTNCLGAQANANFAPSKCVTRSQVAVVVSLKSSHHWLARLCYANHIASDTYNHLLFSVNIEIWSHWQKVTAGQQQYSSNSPVIWISNSRLLLLENGPVINLFSLLFVFITIHAVQVKSYYVPFSHILISQYQKEWLHSDALGTCQIVRR